ncbi:MAG: hypothetical protein AAFY65_04515 [Pseudomonadota bacterium]
MLNAIKTFSADESGAVTVDWVVLTAALVGLGLAVMTVISGGIDNLSNDVSNVMESDITSKNSTLSGANLITPK